MKILFHLSCLCTQICISPIRGGGVYQGVSIPGLGIPGGILGGEHTRGGIPGGGVFQGMSIPRTSDIITKECGMAHTSDCLITRRVSI